MITSTWGQWVHFFLGFNMTLQMITVATGIIGCVFSLYAVADAVRSRRALMMLHLNGIRLGLVRMHVITHSGIFVAQAIVTLASLVTASLPDVPVAMYAIQPDGAWTVTVILIRKFLTLAESGVLLGTAVYKVRWLHMQEGRFRTRKGDVFDGVPRESE